MGSRQETGRPYTRRARHLDLAQLPPRLTKHLPAGPLAMADVGCGDGPLFAALERCGYISPAQPVYAVDLAPERLSRVADRFPYIMTIQASADHMAPIPDASLDAVIAMMVVEHVSDESRMLDEVRRTLKAGGLAFLTTVFKRKWAWYFRRRDGESVLDVSHLREYTDMGAFRSLLGVGRRFACLRELVLEPLWFPVVAPFLFLAAEHVGARGLERLAALRFAKLPVPGYYSLIAMLEA